MTERDAAVSPVKSYLPWADLQGLTPQQSAFQRTHPLVRRQILNGLRGGDFQTWAGLSRIHRAQSAVDALRAREGRPSPYTHPSRPQPWHNPMDMTMRMPALAAVIPGDPQHGLGRGHTAPASGPTMDDPEDAGLPDVYDHPEYYVQPRDRRDPVAHASGMENWLAVRAARGNPDAQVKIYRAVPHGITEIEGNTNPAGASWVSASPSYAKRHAEAESCPSCGGDMQVISGMARAGDLHNEGYLEEWGYTGDPIHDESALTECPEGAYEARKAAEAEFMKRQGSAIPDESGIKAAGIAVIAMDTGRVLMQQRALNPLHCPCGLGVTWDELNGYQHDDGSVSHDGDFYGQSVSDLLDQGHPEEDDDDSDDGEVEDGLDDESGFDKTAALEYDPNEGTWEFPGGKLDPGESARVAAVREFREEVGQDIPPGVFVGAWLSPGGLTVAAAADEAADSGVVVPPGFKDLENLGWSVQYRPRLGEYRADLEDEYGTAHRAHYDPYMNGWTVYSEHPNGRQEQSWEKTPQAADKRARIVGRGLDVSRDLGEKGVGYSFQNMKTTDWPVETRSLFDRLSVYEARQRLDLHVQPGDESADIKIPATDYARATPLGTFGHIDYHYLPPDPYAGPKYDYHHVFASVRDRKGEGWKVGDLHWSPGNGEIHGVVVHPSLRRHGIADRMYSLANGLAEAGVATPPLHSTDTTRSGEAWIEHAGGPRHEPRLAARKGPIYKGFIYLIQRESDIDLGNRAIANPDDPDGDMSEQSAWWDIEHAKKNPALRKECKQSTPWGELELWADKSVRTNKEVTAMVTKLAAADLRPELPEGLRYVDKSDEPFQVHDEDGGRTRFWRWRDADQMTPPVDQAYMFGYSPGGGLQHFRSTDVQPMVMLKPQTDFPNEDEFDLSNPGINRVKTQVKWEDPICETCYLKHNDFVPAGRHNRAMSVYRDSFDEDKHEFKPMAPDTDEHGNLKESAVKEAARLKGKFDEEGFPPHLHQDLMNRFEDIASRAAGLPGEHMSPLADRLQHVAAPLTDAAPQLNRVVRNGVDDDFSEGARIHDVTLPSGDWYAKSPQFRHLNDAEYSSNPDDAMYFLDRAGEDTDMEEFASRLGRALSNPGEEPITPEVFRGHKAVDPSPTVYIRKYPNFHDMRNVGRGASKDHLNTQRGKLFGYFHSVLGDGDHEEFHNMGLLGTPENHEHGAQHMTPVSIDHTKSSLPQYAEALAGDDPDHTRAMAWFHEPGAPSPFAKAHFLSHRSSVWSDGGGHTSLKPNPLGPADTDRALAATEMMRPWAQSRGREAWLDAAQRRMRMLGEHASGSESMFPYQMAHEQVPILRTGATASPVQAAWPLMRDLISAGKPGFSIRKPSEIDPAHHDMIAESEAPRYFEEKDLSPDTPKVYALRASGRSTTFLAPLRHDKTGQTGWVRGRTDQEPNQWKLYRDDQIADAVAGRGMKKNRGIPYVSPDRRKGLPEGPSKADLRYVRQRATGIPPEPEWQEGDVPLDEEGHQLVEPKRDYVAEPEGMYPWDFDWNETGDHPLVESDKPWWKL